MSGHSFHPFHGSISRRFREAHLSPEDAYLSYHDIRLTKEDYDCMKDDWLTDNAIAFYEEYLEHEYLPKYPKAHVILLRPSMCFMLNQTPDPTTLRSALPDFTRSTHIFLPINDNTSPNTAEGGSHWSLLLVSTIDGVGFHYDSLRPSNHKFAEMANYKLSQLLGKPLQLLEMNGSPQQDNGSDCGIYVTLTMKFLLLKRLLTRDTSGQISMAMDGMHLSADKGRKDMMQLVDEFRKEGRSSMSRSRSPFGRNHEQSRSPPRIGD